MTLISVAIKLLWFIVSKNFHARLFFLTVGIFLLATTSTLQRAEFSPEEKFSEPPKVSIPVTEKISQPKPSATFKLPEIVTASPATVPTPVTEKILQPTQPATIQTKSSLPTVNNLPPIQKNFSGLIKTKFYLNGVLYNQSEHKDKHVKISREEWQKNYARLHITNDTGNVLKAPTIKFTLGQNWGDKFTDKKTLPDLAVGESADFEIPFNLLKVSDKPNTGTYIQIYLEGKESSLEENYWAEWFDITN